MRKRSMSRRSADRFVARFAAWASRYYSRIFAFIRGSSFRRQATIAFGIVAMNSLLLLPTFGAEPALRIGWASADLTPDRPVLIGGQFHARVSEGVMDPVTATVLALESVRGEKPTRLIMVSCDLININDAVRDGVRERLRETLPDVAPLSIILFGTHTHSAPYTAVRPRFRPDPQTNDRPYGVDFNVMPPSEYVAFATERIANAVIQAWNGRQPGAIAFGLGHAVVGRNRLMAYRNGKSQMYGNINRSNFSHVEGYEEASLHVLTTYDADRKLTGMILNLACPSQVSEREYRISADFWHETRQEIRRRFGDHVHVLAQHGPAGDQSPRILVDQPAEMRMWRLAGRTQRQEIAWRIAEAVSGLLPLIEKEIETNPVLRHRVETLELPRRQVPERDVKQALAESDRHRKRYEQWVRELEANPEARKRRRWYHDVSRAYRLSLRGRNVADRVAIQETHPNIEIEVHVVRLGEVAFATNPFELYLDFGMQMRARSKATQTFLIQLAGPGSYLPTQRSVRGGAYGALPASTEVGPESGDTLVDWTVETINRMF